MTVELSQIKQDDLELIGEFLRQNLNTRMSAATWVAGLSVPWVVDAPNFGFMLRDGQRVVGVHLAFYSERSVGGQVERFCNLGAWCVLPEYRFHSVRLLRALLAQHHYHFTDLSPSGNVVALNARLRFRSLDTATALIPNLPLPSWPGRTKVSSDPAVIAACLDGRDLEIYHDHAGAAAARHLIVSRGGDACYVMFRKVRRKNLPLFASVLYASNPDLLRRAIGPVTRHLLLHAGAMATLAELRIVRHRPYPSVMLSSPRPKMFRSETLQPAQIDDLYSELTCVPW
jgi:hypothetical protein